MARIPRLSDLQLILLATACQRDDGSLLPPPDSLGEQGARIKKAVAALLKRQLAEEVGVAVGDRAWRVDGERQIGVIITPAGRAIIESQEEKSDNNIQASPTNGNASAISLTDAAITVGTPPSFAAGLLSANALPAAPTARAGTKQALLVDMLAREKGASIDELAAATGWLPHTTRAALTGLRKKGHAVDRDRDSGVTRYRILKAA